MALTHLLRQSATYTNPNSGEYNAEGTEVFGSASTIAVRFERVTKSIIKADRTMEPVHGKVFVDKSVDIEVGAKLTYDSEVFRVLEVNDIPKGNGQIHHRELLVQRWSYG